MITLVIANILAPIINFQQDLELSRVLFTVDKDDTSVVKKNDSAVEEKKLS